MSDKIDDSSDLTDVIEKEITKTTISQSLGTLLYPITREIANLEEKGISKIKSYIKNKRKMKLGEENKKEIEDLITEIEEKPENLVKIEKINSAVELASSCEIEDEKLFLLWDAILKKIAKGDVDTGLLVKTLENISPQEADFIINFDKYRNKKIIISNFLKFLGSRRYKSHELLKLEQIAMSLAKKGIVEQPFSIIPILMNFTVFLVVGLLGRALLSIVNIEKYEDNSLLVNNLLANSNFGVVIAIIFGVVGAFLTFQRPYPLVLTWLGKRLREGALKVKKTNNT